MARQVLAEGPYVDPPVTSPLSADVATTAVDMWSGARYTPIFANDPKAGKIYVVKAGGLITTAATGALTITPFYGTNTGVALGASIAQTVPASSLSGPWFLEFTLVFLTIGAPGVNSTCIGEGVFVSGGVAATANSGLQVTFGGTSATVDASVNKDITIQKSLSVAGAFTTHWCYIHAIN